MILLMSQSFNQLQESVLGKMVNVRLVTVVMTAVIVEMIVEMTVEMTVTVVTGMRGKPV